jgi:hypothetical protein
MKTLSLLVLLSSVSAYAEHPCKGKAIKAAMSAYLQGGAIQGDDPTPSYRLVKSIVNELTHSVTIDGENDEGESWTMTYRVKTKPAPSCKVTLVRKVTNY